MFKSYAEYELALPRDFLTFLERCFGELYPDTLFSMRPHLALLADELTACINGGCKRLIVSLPPRSLKSFMFSAALPAFLLGQDPSKQIICASYGQELADKHARDTKTIMSSSFYKRAFPRTRLHPNRLAVNDFMTTQQGFRMATSVGGTLTGRGGDYIIIDDPLKPDEALSETSRNTVNQWSSNTVLSRLNNKEKGVMIVVMQRLHQDDLVGHLTEHGGWRVISLPAIAVEEEDYLIQSPFSPFTRFRRRPGDVLDPDRESLESLQRTRANVGAYIFQSQYQQDPTPVGGSIIKADWFTYYDPSQPLPDFTTILQSWDTANKSGELHNFSICTTWGSYMGSFYLLDVLRERLDFPALKRRVMQQYEKFRPRLVLVEDRASGTQLIQEFKFQLGSILHAVAPPPQMDKVLRLHSQTVPFEDGKVLLPTSAPWLAEYQREMLTFPGSKYDDQVDSTTQALNYMRTNNGHEIFVLLGRAARRDRERQYGIR